MKSKDIKLPTTNHLVAVEDRVPSIPSRCTSLSLRRAARAASQILESYLESLNLGSSQFGILNHLSREGSLTMTGLADAMFLDRTTVTRNLQILQRDGLVQVLPGTDKRVREVALTTHGCEVLRQAIPLWEQAEAAVSARVGSESRSALLKLGDALSALTPE